MNGAEISRAQEHRSVSQELSAKGDQISTFSDESEDSENIVHRSIRMVRKFPEESRELADDNHQALTPRSQTTCICPELLNKGTLVAIIASLAFLGFFSTLVLLLAAIVILRVMDKQSKKEKKERRDTDASKRHFSHFLRRQKESLPPTRPIPPIPLRPSQRVYLSPLPVPKYGTAEAAESSYVDPKELQPGPPRSRYESKYESSEGAGAETKSTPEKAYISMGPEPSFFISTPENAYTTVLSAPFSTSTPENAYTSMLPGPNFSTPSPEHVYATIPSPQAEHSYAAVDEPQSESMADASLVSEEQTKGPEEHIYEEIE